MIVVKIWEGLGNQMFQYAYAKSLQITTGQRVCLDVEHCNESIRDGRRTPRKYELDYFRITLPTIRNVEKHYFYLNEKQSINRVIKELAKRNLFPYRYYEEQSIVYKSDLLKVHGNLYLQGWFQNQDYFKNSADIIRRDFKLKKQIGIPEKLRQLLKMPNTVSVHIRRGDYKKLSNVLPIEYYQKAVDLIQEKVEHPLFLVFSDEIEWAMQNFIIQEPCYFVNRERILEDYEELMVMKHCRHHIIANSTYSWWGAWLGDNLDKIVIGPKVWFLQNKSWPNIMPEDWKII